MTLVTMRKLCSLALAICLARCAHQRLSPGDLDRVSHPAFVSRIEEGAGPKSRVFADDGSYREKLNRLEPVEADRRLRLKLGQGIGRFEVSDRLRAVTLANLPRERPWTQTVDPVAVATVLQSFLVEEVPANPPDYDLLRPLNADAVVEFVVREYGMRSTGGHGGAYASGYGRLFFLGGGEIWRSSFSLDQISLGEPSLDPFEVAKHPEDFREALSRLLDQAAVQFAKELNPLERRVQPGSPSPTPKSPPKGQDDTLNPPEQPQPDTVEPKKTSPEPGS